MTSITFIRHGESLANANPIIRFQHDYNDEDVGLSEVGRTQVEECGKRLTSSDNTLWWSSPMNRAIQTTKLLAPEKHFIVDPRLREMKWPSFRSPADKSIHDVRRKELGMFTYGGDDFECGEQVVRRLKSFLKEHMPTMACRHNIIVCHEIVMRAFKYLQTRDPLVFDTVNFDNCETFTWIGYITELFSQ